MQSNQITETSNCYFGLVSIQNDIAEAGITTRSMAYHLASDVKHCYRETPLQRIQHSTMHLL